MVQSRATTADNLDSGPPPFGKTLADHGLALVRGETRTLQVNVGLVCNQVCRHCHLEAGPARQEAMDETTVRQVAAYARSGGFEIVDVTSGAPEMNPHLPLLLELASEAAPRVMLRANLTALMEHGGSGLLDLLVRRRIVVAASFPAPGAAQTDAQRGAGVFERSIEALRRLNERGYGREDTGLELDLVSNPPGAFLPPAQESAEKRFRALLAERWSIVFNRLFTFANVPLGRFRTWLKQSGNYDAYLKRLAEAFNPCAAAGVMCRTQVSAAWDGCLYDCDFNLAAGLPLGGRRLHVSEVADKPRLGTPVAVGDHCYTCTAGSGFT